MLSHLFQLKSLLLGFLLVSPAVAAWVLRDDGERLESRTAPTVPTRLPVEVIGDQGSQWRYVAVETTAVPEPGIIPLLILPTIFLLRRSRN